MTAQIICVDDQAEVRELLEEIFSGRGKQVRTFAAGADAIAHLKTSAGQVALVLLDLDLGPSQPDGLHFLREIRAEHPELPTVILTGKGTVETAVAALQAGATDFIEKDLYLEDKIELSVGKIERVLALTRERDELAETNRSLRQRVDELVEALESRYTIVGDSAAIRGVLEKAVRVAPLPRPVLIVGERGTGKELFAHAIHRADSTRAGAPFVVMNCGAVPESLLESELFGHEKGAFTGATQRKLGKFELADGGTLFLDEIGNMSAEFQIKILRVLEYQRFQRVAGSAELQVDVRVIAATNVDLRQAIAEGTFRADLYDRLAFEVIELPPLRDRKEDIPLLAQYFVQRFRSEVGALRCARISAEAAAVLGAYAFPGNVRELKNIVERALYAAGTEELRAADVEAALPSSSAVASAPVGEGRFSDQVAAFEQRILTAALATCDWSQKDAAERLGLTYDQFRHMYRKYKLGQLRPEG